NVLNADTPADDEVPSSSNPARGPPHAPESVHLILARSPAILALYIYRGVVRFLGKRSGLVDQLTPYDCIFAVDSYYTPPLRLEPDDPRAPIQDGRSHDPSSVQDPYPRQPKFFETALHPTGYWFWKRIQVDLSASVSVFHDSELNHNEADLDECLRKIVEMRYHNELFNLCLLNFGTKTYLVFRIHHTVCDGYSFNKLIDVFVGLQSKYLVKCNHTEFKPMQIFKEVLLETVKWAKLLSNLPLHLCTLYKESLTHTPNFYTLRKAATTGQIRRRSSAARYQDAPPLNKLPLCSSWDVADDWSSPEAVRRNVPSLPIPPPRETGDNALAAKAKPPAHDPLQPLGSGSVQGPVHEKPGGEAERSGARLQRVHDAPV
ncbi:hypothetical protein Ocin01_14053, partial [Orchesella cincta]